MTDCERLSDRMPEVALQRAAWSAEEALHLAGCAECQAEWDLVQRTRRLESRAPAVDVEAVAAAVQRRLAREGEARRRTRWVWTVGSAAAAAAAIALAVVGGERSEPGTAPQVVAEAEPLVPLPELEELDTVQLDTLLRVLDGPLAGSTTLESTTLGDEADAELERILATWEG